MVEEEKKKVFSEIAHSTNTVKGIVSHVRFDEKTVMSFLEIKGNILFIDGNFGSITAPGFNPNPVKEKKSNRGRKPKKKEKTKKTKNGTGHQFNSQISFHIRNVQNNRIYQIKLFQVNSLVIPGVLDPYLSDIIPVIEEFQGYLRYVFMDEEITITGLKPTMENYTCYLLNSEYHANDKHIETDNVKINLKQLDVVLSQEILKRGEINIIDSNYSNERYCGLLAVFKRPKLDKPDKDTTVKIFSKGSINNDGRKRKKEAVDIYNWLEKLFIDNYYTIVYNRKLLQKIDNIPMIEGENYHT